MRRVKAPSRGADLTRFRGHGRACAIGGGRRLSLDDSLPARPNALLIRDRAPHVSVGDECRRSRHVGRAGHVLRRERADHRRPPVHRVDAFRRAFVGELPAFAHLKPELQRAEAIRTDRQTGPRRFPAVPPGSGGVPWTLQQDFPGSATTSCGSGPASPAISCRKCRKSCCKVEYLRTPMVSDMVVQRLGARCPEGQMSRPLASACLELVVLLIRRSPGTSG